MIYGTETVTYTPVEGNGVSLFAEGIMSGGTGGDATVTQGVRFLWVYDPDHPTGSPSGFTGQGWFAEVEGSPIWHSTQNYGITLDVILKEFKGGTRINLNDVFTRWQNYVDAAGSQGNDVLKQFQERVGYDCWSNLNNN